LYQTYHPYQAERYSGKCFIGIQPVFIITESDGEEKFVVQEFSTFTDDFFKLKSWLLNHDCTIVAMESKFYPFDMDTVSFSF